MGFLSAENIFSGYSEKDVLQGVSVRIESSEIVTIIGPNGAGKSTLLKTLAGLLRPRKGEIYFQGKPIHGLRPAEITRMGICYVPQEENIFPSLSVSENLEMGAYVLQKGWQQRQEEVFSPEEIDIQRGRGIDPPSFIFLHFPPFISSRAR